MIRKVLEVNNKEGLRARAAAIFVQTASKFQSLIIIEKGNKKINAKSIMGVLSLGVVQGENIHISADGADEKEALKALQELVASPSAEG